MRNRRARHNNRDRLPKGLRNRFFKDPGASAERFGQDEHAVISACDFAWSDPRARTAVRGWLLEAQGEYLSFEIETRRGLVVRAVFRRDVRQVEGIMVAVATDALAPKTVYCGLEMHCPAGGAPSMLSVAHA